MLFPPLQRRPRPRSGNKIQEAEFYRQTINTQDILQSLGCYSQAQEGPVPAGKDHTCPKVLEFRVKPTCWGHTVTSSCRITAATGKECRNGLYSNLVLQQGNVQLLSCFFRKQTALNAQSITELTLSYSTCFAC